MRIAAALLFVGDAAGHALMTLPHSRNGGTLAHAGMDGGGASWFTTATRTSHIPTLPVNMITVMAPFPTKPWQAPGTAPINSPCGQTGTVGPSGGGRDGRNLPPKTRAVWTAGETAKVAWAIWQNHGGGYAYRLCPASQKPTEDCFQQHHLNFADTDPTAPTTIIHWQNGTEIPIPAHRAMIDGKHWTKNPIPTDEEGAPFRAPCPGCKGGTNKFNMIDRVEVPADIAPGDYMISWRWDCEVSNQVWVNCGDITIKAGSGPAPKPPAPQPQPPAPKPVATTYGCTNNVCVADPTGVPKATCDAVCHL